MDLKRLNYFVRVAETGSLLGTAEKIGIAESSLSRQIRMLESELGVQLFERHARGMELTAQGRHLYTRVARPIREIGEACFDMRAMATEVAGNVTLGMPPTVVQSLAGALASRVAQFSPNISLRIVDSYTGHLLDWLRRGELDIAILYGPVPDDLHAEELLQDELLLVGPAKAPVCANGSIDFVQLRDLPLILPSPNHGLRKSIDSAARAAGLSVNVRIQADSYQLMKELVQSGLGYTLLPHAAFRRETQDGRLTFARIRKPTVIRRLALATRPCCGLPSAVEQIAQLLKQEVLSRIAQGEWAVSSQACLEPC